MRSFKASDGSWINGRGYSKKILFGQKDIDLNIDLVQEVSFKKGDRVPLHHHDVQTEIFYAIDKAWFNINGIDMVLEPGDVIVCEPGDVHGNPTIPHDFKILVLKMDHAEDDLVWDER